MNQPTPAPTTKVSVAAVSGAVVTVILSALSAYVVVPPEVAAALVVLVSFGMSYLVPER